MPLEGAKEVAKVAVETSGSAMGWIVAALGGVGASIAGIWKHIHSRVSILEQSIVTHNTLREHINDEEEKFQALFNKHDTVIDKINNIGNAVARIEGKLSNNHDWQDPK